MDWAAAEKRHDPATPEGRIFSSLRQLETLRAAHRAFDGLADTWIIPTGDDGVLGIGRYYNGEKLVALFNFSADPRRVSVMELGDFHDLLTGTPANMSDISIPAGGFAWLLCDFDEKEDDSQ